MRRLSALLLAALAACAPYPDDTVRNAAARDVAIPLPPMQRFFAAPRPLAPVSNADLARDFLDLTFQLESGRPVPLFTRFEGPVFVDVSEGAPASLEADLDGLLRRLRSEAGIDISRGRGPNQITINAIPRATLRASLPDAACFVIPNVTSWYDYRQARRSGLIDWTNLTVRRRMAVFLPNDVAPQEIRDCLHEEIAQALGPVNDLYRLPDSIFNDDNIHTVLTGFDMLVLRATYDPALSNGLRRDEVAARLPAVLSRLNPGGNALPARNRAETPRAWVDHVERALGPGATNGQRRRAAERALALAQSAGWNDHRTGFAHYILGRFTVSSDPRAALAHFLAADRIFAQDPGTRLHRAHVAGELAAAALAANDPQTALARLDPAIDTMLDAQNAGVLATLLLLKSDALDMVGRQDEAQALRLDSLGWARYGFVITEARRTARR